MILEGNPALVPAHLGIAIDQDGELHRVDPNYAWEKKNFSLREECRDLVRGILGEMEPAQTID